MGIKWWPYHIFTDQFWLENKNMPDTCTCICIHVSINLCYSFVRTVDVLSQWTFGTYTNLRWLKSLWHLSEFFPSFTKSNSCSKVSFKSCGKEKYMFKIELPIIFQKYIPGNVLHVLKILFHWKQNNLQNPGKCKLWMHPTNQLQQLFTGPDITSKPVL